MKNKIITIYDLVLLIKSNKAPKKIFYNGSEYRFCKNIGDYRKFGMGHCLIMKDVLENDTVEILPEENYEWEDIEEINSNADNTLFVMECYTGIPEKAQDWNFNILEKEINQLIKNQKYLKEKLEGKDD